MRKEISFLQFSVSFIIGIYASIMFIHFVINYFNPKHFLFMTQWNFYISTIYLIVVSICDFSLYILKTKKLEKINELFREKLSPAFTALTYLVSFTFWIMIFPVLLKKGNGNFGLTLYFNLYLHLFLTIFQTIDIFISYRKKRDTLLIQNDILVAVFIMGMYSLLSLILVYGFDKPIYPFLNNMTWYKAIFELILFQLMTFLFYLIHTGLIRLKYKNKIYILFDDNEKKYK